MSDPVPDPHAVRRDMPAVSRRAILHAGLGAVAIGLLRLKGLGGSSAFAHSMPPPGTGTHPLTGLGFPVLDLPSTLDSVMIDGLPFSQQWTGDDFGGAFPFHSCENCFPSGRPPEPAEQVEVAIIGGGLSGLCTAHALRDRRIALFEMRDRMGGVAAGERWRGTTCSLGSAYFIVPDLGSELEMLYRELGVWPGTPVAPGELSAEIDGTIINELVEWNGFTFDERLKVSKYAAAVRYFANESYPEIPLPVDRPVEWIFDLDRRTLREDIERRLGGTVPARLAEGIQAYCYSSFGASWERLSAAAGWNFLAAEEFGRIVLSGGNSGLAVALWHSVRASELAHRRSILRPNRRVVDVRLDGDGVCVSWHDGTAFASLRARHVVFANAKFVAKSMLPELERLDPEKLEAFHQVGTVAYVVVNVLAERTAARRLYDLFLLGDGNFPMEENAAERAVKVIDVLDGGYGTESPTGSTVLTLYWPLPWPAARFTIIEEESHHAYAKLLAPQLRSVLELLGIPESAIHQIRMSRWGHAMPIAKPEALAAGLPELLRRPIADRIWFVNQDNWLLPAVETCLLEALHFAPQIRARL